MAAIQNIELERHTTYDIVVPFLDCQRWQNMPAWQNSGDFDEIHTAAVNGCIHGGHHRRLFMIAQKGLDEYDTGTESVQ